MAKLSLDQVADLATSTLTTNGLDKQNTEALVRTITNAERDGSHSHGLFRVPGYVASLRSGKVNGSATPKLNNRSAGVLHVDGDGGYASLPLEALAAPLTDMTKANGVALAAVTDVYHFAALWPETEQFSDAGLVAMAMTQASPFVAPAGGKEAVFGTNPMAFSWPRPKGENMTFDQASAAMARGDVQIAARDGKSVPIGTGNDKNGNPTEDPSAILDGGVQLAFGGYKGSAIALMVELMASTLIGSVTSAEAKAIGQADGGPSVGGELIVAFDPAVISGNPQWMDHSEQLLSKLEGMDGVRLPGARRHRNRDAAEKAGGSHLVDVSDSLLETINKLNDD